MYKRVLVQSIFIVFKSGNWDLETQLKIEFLQAVSGSIKVLKITLYT